jgi:hypothetical protein
LLLDLLVDGLRLARDDEFVGAEFYASGNEQIASQSAGRCGDGCVIREHRDEAGVSRSGLRQDARQTIESLLFVGALSVAEASIAFDASALLAQQQCRDLEARSVGGLEWALLYRGFDLSRRACQNRDHAGVIARPCFASLLIGALTGWALPLS